MTHRMQKTSEWITITNSGKFKTKEKRKDGQCNFMFHLHIFFQYIKITHSVMAHVNSSSGRPASTSTNDHRYDHSFSSRTKMLISGDYIVFVDNFLYQPSCIIICYIIILLQLQNFQQLFTSYCIIYLLYCILITIIFLCWSFITESPTNSSQIDNLLIT